MRTKREEVLQTLDSASEKYDFPMFNNEFFHYADCRLSVFLTNDEWIVVFEEVAFTTQHLFGNWIAAYGNTIETQGTQRIIKCLSPMPGTTFVDEHGMLSMNPNSFEVLIHGKRYTFSPSKSDLVNLGVTADMPLGAQIIRWVSNELGSDLFITSSLDLLSACGRGSASPDLFLQTEKWNHPDIANDILPSRTNSFRSLARAIETGDATMFKAGRDNTDWKLWIP